MEEEEESGRNLEVRVLNGNEYREQCAEMEDEENHHIFEEGWFTFPALNVLQHARMQCVEVVEVQDSLPWIETFDLMMKTS